MLKHIFIFVSLLLSFTSSTEVTLENLQTFFKYTYDLDNTSTATLQEFVDYFTFMEPDHNITIDTIRDTFDLFDSNNDGLVNIAELVSIAKVKIVRYQPGHKQIHLGLTANEAEMQVIWVSNPETYSNPIVQYGHYPTQLHSKAYAIKSTYNVGKIGFHGTIYKAIMSGLSPLKRYYYRVGDQKTQTFSSIKFFQAPPLKDTNMKQINMAVFGDMGTFAPLGHMVMSQLSRDNLVKPYNFVFLTGDIAYAGMNSEKVGEIEPIWDLFGELSQSFAAYTAFMPGVGNHERYYNYSSYFHRYDLPKVYQGQTNLWFSFDYAQVHMVHFSSEHPYTLGSEQYAFLENDLRKASSNPNTKWIILGVHRAFYSSDQCQYSEVTPLARALEDLVNKYKVDIVQTGHLHSYERSWPVFKGKAEKQGHTQTQFVSPKHPIYVVQGTAGALINEKWISPTPQWSVRRLLKYGYGRINIQGNNLKYQFISAANGKIVDQWSIKK